MAKEQFKPSYHDDLATLLIQKQDACPTQVELGIRDRLLQALACPLDSTGRLVPENTPTVMAHFLIGWLNFHILRAQQHGHYQQAIRYQYNAYQLQDGVKSALQIIRELSLQPLLVRF